MKGREKRSLINTIDLKEKKGKREAKKKEWNENQSLMRIADRKVKRKY